MLLELYRRQMYRVGFGKIEVVMQAQENTNH